MKDYAIIVSDVCLPINDRRSDRENTKQVGDLIFLQFTPIVYAVHHFHQTISSYFYENIQLPKNMHSVF